MRSISAILLILFSIVHAPLSIAQTTRFERSKGTETPVYKEGMQWWKALDQKYAEVSIKTMGPTDAGIPLHLVIISKDKNADLISLRKKNKKFLLINNAIHPGESDGVDASMLFAREMLEKKTLPDDVVVCIIPFYNIGGTLNRNSSTRANQNGPAEYGFRGNSQNLDLNRDFIKCDSKEARSFAQIFHLVDPDIFLDNHVSNGADYQHIITLLATNYDKLGGASGKYLREELNPGIFSAMKKKGYDLVPYVDFETETPESGIVQFNDQPRFSSGYAALWQTISFLPEMHMLKDYKQRVLALKVLLETFTEYLNKHGHEIRAAKLKDIDAVKTQKSFGLSWTADNSRFDKILFNGYEAGHKPSEISGLPRLYYNRSKPFSKEIPYYSYFNPTIHAAKPKAYIIPQGWWAVIELLKLNKVEMRSLKNDTSIEVEYYRIDQYKSLPRPYEKHHLNYDVKMSTYCEKMSFRKGDIIIYLNQRANRFLMETLEPNAPDSYFSWNFFDAILGQKEGYSDYVFEDMAAEILKKDTALQNKLNEKRKNDSAFAKSAAAQLDFVYKHSNWYEKAHLRYPVYRITAN
jgi:hypothetical protein